MAAPSTINFTAINDGSFYTISDLNELFRTAANVINGKLDAGLGQERQQVVVGERRVLVSTSPVILQDQSVAKLYSDLSVNFQRIRNLKEGSDATDAITVAQARAILGAA